MSRLNPLYIVVLLSFVLAIIVWQDQKFQKLIEQKEERLYQLEKSGRKMATLKRYWKDERLQKRRIQEFLRFAAKFVKKKEQRGKNLYILLDDIDAQNADRIAEKLLNSFVKIKKIKIERKKREYISMEVELSL